MLEESTDRKAAMCHSLMINKIKFISEGRIRLKRLKIQAQPRADGQKTQISWRVLSAAILVEEDNATDRKRTATLRPAVFI